MNFLHLFLFRFYKNNMDIPASLGDFHEFKWSWAPVDHLKKKQRPEPHSSSKTSGVSERSSQTCSKHGRRLAPRTQTQLGSEERGSPSAGAVLPWTTVDRRGMAVGQDRGGLSATLSNAPTSAISASHLWNSPLAQAFLFSLIKLPPAINIQSAVLILLNRLQQSMM